MTNAKQQQYRVDTMTRQGDAEMAGFLEEGRKSTTQEQVDAIRLEHPDLPRDGQYDLHSVIEQGLWRDADAKVEGQDKSFRFLPDEGYKYDPIGMKYDVNSKTYQYDAAVPRMVRGGIAQGYGHLLEAGSAPIAKMMAGMYEGGEEEARSDIEKVWTPDYLLQARNNPADTMQAYGEQMGSALIGFGVDWFGGKQVMRSRGVTQATKAAKSDAVIDAIEPAKWKSMVSNFATRLEQETQPALIMAEFINAADPLNDINAAPMVGEWLEANGMSGHLVDYLKNSQDDRFSKGVTNVVLGTMMMELMRGAGTAGLKIGKYGYDNAAEFVQTAYKNASDEVASLQKILDVSMVAFHGSGAIQAVANRGVKGDDLLNTEDLIEELQGVGAIISDDGMVTAYHRTSKENAENIYRTGTMTAKEPDIFFSTSIDSEYGKGFGDDYVAVEIPVEQLRLDDVFPGKDASVSIPVKGKIGTPVKVKVLKRNEEKVK